MASYPREISLQNGRVIGTIDIRPNHVVSERTENKIQTAREIMITRFNRDSSYSDMPRQYTGVDIRTQETDKICLMAPNGGQLRSAYSEVEGLDRYATKESQDDSSREIERSKDSVVQLERPVHQGTNKPAATLPTRPIEGLTQFEKIKCEFQKRSTIKAETRAGKRIGFYRLILDIGRGNFSKVKLGTHSLLNAEVAVKVIDRTKFDAKTRRLLSQELANMERLSHPNIIQLYEVHEVTQRWHLIMEYAPAGELHSFIRRNGRLEDKLARSISAQIISALKHMHTHGVVHRDLKAENILFVDSTNIKVGDFGFSKKINLDAALTTFCGSPPYAAPELFVADSYNGPAVDMWALGVLIYYMAVGNLPFRGDSIGKIKRLILECYVDYPLFLPMTCKDLIRGLLNPDVNLRYTIAQTQQSPWFEDTDWSERSRGTQRLPDQLDDQAVRDLLNRWWNVENWELERALSEGPKNSLTGIYRILRSQGRQYLDYKAPSITKKTKSLKKSRERKKDHHHNRTDQSVVGLDVNGRRRSKPVALKHREELTSVDLRDDRTVKGKIDKEGQTTSRTCALL